MVDALVISGHGAYADPWHPFAETSQRLAEVVAGLGYSVAIRDDVEQALAEPGECQLLVVNIGNPQAPGPVAAVEAIGRGLDRHLAGGGSLLGMHVSATSLTTLPLWRTILGGRWVRGVTMHPPQDDALILVSTRAHPITAGLADFQVFDERYSYLATEPDITVLCEHEYEGRRHPVVWARVSDTARIVYDGLGHDARSYDSQGHLALLRGAVIWLLDR